MPNIFDNHFTICKSFVMGVDIFTILQKHDNLSIIQISYYQYIIQITKILGRL